jgi:glutaredoxin
MDATENYTSNRAFTISTARLAPATWTLVDRLETSWPRTLAATATLLVLPACSELGDRVEELLGRDEREAPSTVEAPEAPPEERLPEKPPTSTARSETEVISFRSVLENTEMTREERIRALQNLDPSALQKPVARPNVSGGPSSARPERSPNGRTPADWEIEAARRRVPITMYSTTWCGVCKRARAYFEEKQLAFEERDVDKDPQARVEYERLNPRRSVPTIKIGDQVVIGFSPGAVESALNIAARSRVQ